MRLIPGPGYVRPVRAMIISAKLLPADTQVPYRGPTMPYIQLAAENSFTQSGPEALPRSQGEEGESCPSAS